MEFQTDELLRQKRRMKCTICSQWCRRPVPTPRKLRTSRNFDFDFGHTKIPYYKAPNGMDNQEFFEKLCWRGLERRYGPDVPQCQSGPSEL